MAGCCEWLSKRAYLQPRQGRGAGHRVVNGFQNVLIYSDADEQEPLRQVVNGFQNVLIYSR